jgi:hypothetical protein
MYLTIGYMIKMETKIVIEDVIASDNTFLGTF